MGSLLDDMFRGIEDEDVELEAGNEQQLEEGNTVHAAEDGPRRLKKARDVEQGGGNGSPTIETPGMETAMQPSQQQTEEEDGEKDDDDEEMGDGYWDEEDEIEQYFQLGGGDGNDGSDGEESEDVALELVAGDGTMRGTMDAETQRLLREVATRDRLGRGQKIEIKPLTGIVEKLRKKKEEVRSRAAALRAPEVPTFDDILQDAGLGVSRKEAELKRKSSELNCTNLETCLSPGNSGSDEPTTVRDKQNEKLCTDQEIANNNNNNQEPKTPRKEHVEEEEDGLEVVSDQEEDGGGDFKLIDVPRMTPTKPSPLAFNPYNATQDVEDFEDEELLDDGGEMDSDSESDHSWAVRQEEEEEDDAVSSQRGEKSQDIDGDDNLVEQESNGKSPSSGDEKIDPLAKMMANRERVSDSSKKQDAKIAEKHKGFIDEEAELSDEEGMRHAVSDDEDEDAEDLDKNGELADLIDEGKTTLKDQNATESLHIQWAKQQDAQQLKQILRGLENGFGRRRHGAYDELDGELTGRQRRARYDDDDDLDLGLSTAWPSLFGNPAAVGDEECEDEAMLRKAHQRKLVESQLQQDAFNGSGGSSIPLDEDSQNILELFAKGSSEQQQNQQNNSSSGSGSLKRGRSKELLLFGSDPLSAFGSSGPSFIGRQSKAPKTQNTSTIGALGSAKSFVFGRKEQQNNSNSRLGSDDANTSGSEPVAGPVDFSNLKQLTRSQSTESNSRALRNSNSSLLRNMSKCHKPSNLQKSGSVDLVGAVCNQIAKAKRKP